MRPFSLYYIVQDYGLVSLSVEDMAQSLYEEKGAVPPRRLEEATDQGYSERGKLGRLCAAALLCCCSTWVTQEQGKERAWLLF